DVDDDGNNGHGNDADKCDPSNPNSDKKGCEGGADSPDGNDSDDSGSPSDSGGPGDDPTPSSGGSEVTLCGSAIPVPISIDAIAGKSFQATPSAYATGNDNTGWRCLRVGRSAAQNYQYGYDVGSGTLADSGESYTAWARGDLDGK